MIVLKAVVLKEIVKTGMEQFVIKTVEQQQEILLMGDLTAMAKSFGEKEDLKATYINEIS